MSVFVVESPDPEALEAYRHSLAFENDFPQPGTEVSSGSTEDVELDDLGTVGRIYWLLVEDDRDEDNATFRLNDRGHLEFFATGVEV